tara:strand:- start:28 stop:339 length:312 start_codon:yes stop_codon:yes gene_type:complete
MTADSKKAITLLGELYLLPLDKCIPEDEADHYYRRIADTIKKLRGHSGLPKNDPLRFNNFGERLSKHELNVRLESIIKMWPTWEKEKKRAWKKNYKRSIQKAK